MSNLGFQEKDPKMFQISIAPFSMTRKKNTLGGVIRRRNILVIRISFCSWKHVMGEVNPRTIFFGEIKVGDMKDAWPNARLRKNVSLATNKELLSSLC
ncbi:unnamed protein product [Lactuca saligna]|uniref:Uncharacterized protein n=1 Tax=Lactuca saligna TaxID=75948 RepID=A0AA36EHN1_LACSI|nr:unnamed protein product [Lactuca saligna]